MTRALNGPWFFISMDSRWPCWRLPLGCCSQEVTPQIWGDHGDTVDSSFEGFVGKLDEFRFWDRSVISDLIATPPCSSVAS